MSRGIWRWADDLVPTPAEHRITLGEGGTPLLDLTSALGDSLNGARLLLKCEHLNPSGSFKDRIAAVAVTRALAEGRHGIVGTSSGNGGAAIAIYAAAAGLPLRVLTLPDAPAAKVDQMLASGAHVQPVAGLGHDPTGTLDTAETVLAVAEQNRWLAFLTGARFMPSIMTGAETIAFELVDQCPEATHVYAPVGGGGLVSSLARGYAKRAVRPNLRAVQPSGCPTVQHALDGRDERDLAPVSTTISGLQVSVMFDDVPAALSAPGDALVSIEDADAVAAQQSLAHHGILLERAGATAVAGVLRDAHAFSPDDVVVAVATGAGWKSPDDFPNTVSHPLPSARSGDLRSLFEEADA